MQSNPKIWNLKDLPLMLPVLKVFYGNGKLKAFFIRGIAWPSIYEACLVPTSIFSAAVLPFQLKSELANQQ